jgi:hypothetical protein
MSMLAVAASNLTHVVGGDADGLTWSLFVGALSFAVIWAVYLVRLRRTRRDS